MRVSQEATQISNYISISFPQATLKIGGKDRQPPGKSTRIAGEKNALCQAWEACKAKQIGSHTLPEIEVLFCGSAMLDLHQKSAHIGNSIIVSSTL